MKTLKLANKIREERSKENKQVKELNKPSLSIY
jgi:hypothetical protein